MLFSAINDRVSITGLQPRLLGLVDSLLREQLAQQPFQRVELPWWNLASQVLGTVEQLVMYVGVGLPDTNRH
jgi:hypothetical protein